MAHKSKFAGTGILVSALALPLADIVPVNAQGISQRARDWWVTCDDDLYCIAETPGTSASDNDMQFKLERSSKENGKLFVTVSPGITLKKGMRVDISVLGLDYEAGGEISRVYKGKEMTFAGPPRRKLVDKLREGKKRQITVNYGGDTGKVIYNVSLTGVSSALLLMDQVQHRLDRVDAAIAWGGEPASSPSEPRKPQGDEIVGEDGHEDQSEEAYAAANSGDTNSQSNIGSGGRYYAASDLPDAVAMPGYRTFGCDMETPMQAWGAVGLGMGNGHEIYMVPCQHGDVNIQHYVAIVGPKYGNFANTYEFELPITFNQPNRSTIINPDYDPQSGILTSTSYHSPNYDCGVYEKHQYVADQDYFELLEYREKLNCDGGNQLPENYELVWTIEEMGQ